MSFSALGIKNLSLSVANQDQLLAALAAHQSCLLKTHQAAALCCLETAALFGKTAVVELGLDFGAVQCARETCFAA